MGGDDNQPERHHPAKDEQILQGCKVSTYSLGSLLIGLLGIV